MSPRRSSWRCRACRVGRSLRKPLRRPENCCSGLTSSERAARPLRLARPVAGLRSSFRECDCLLRIVSFANARLGSRAARRPASSGPPPRSTGHAFAGGRSAERSDALRSRKVGASIPRGEFVPCDPRFAHNPRRIGAPGRCRPTAALTRRGFERSERMRCDHFPGTRSGALRRMHDRCGSAASRTPHHRLLG